MAYSAYVLVGASRSALSKTFQPKFNDFIGHHVTIEFGIDADAPVPEVPDTIRVVGYTCDDSLEALIVEVNGSIRRPDGKVYHITWSLDREAGRKPVHSNQVIDDQWFTRIDSDIDIIVEPKVLR